MEERKGEWAELADEGIVPPRDNHDEDPQLGSGVTGQTTGSDEPATAEGIDLSAGDESDATSDGGASQPPPGVEPDLKDAAARPRKQDVDSAR